MLRFLRLPPSHVLALRSASSAAPKFGVTPRSALRAHSTQGPGPKSSSTGLSAALLFGLVGSSILTGIGIAKLPQLSTTPGQGVRTQDRIITGLHWKEDVYPSYNLKQAGAALRAGEVSRSLSGGVSRVDSVKHASNSPVEDEMAYESVEVRKGQKWHFWGVYDGHAYVPLGLQIYKKLTRKGAGLPLQCFADL